MSTALAPPDSTALTVTVVETREQLHEATHAWLEMLDRGTVGHNVHNDPRMISLMLEQQPQFTPQILLVTLDGRLVCVAPFYRQPSRFTFEFSVWRLLTLRAKVLRLFGESVVVAADVDPARCIDAIASFLQNGSTAADYLQIYGLNFSDQFWQAAIHDHALARQAGCSMITMSPEKNRQLRVEESFDAYLMTLSSDSRRMVRRHTRNFFKDSTSRLVRVTQPDDVPQLVDWMTCVHQDTWQAKTFGVEQKNDAAYCKLLEQAAHQGWLRSYVLLRGDEPIAFKHNYQYRGTLYSEETGYRQQHASLSPGIVVTFRVLEDIHEDHAVDIWDFGFGDLPYKRTFCKTAHDVAIVYFVPRNRWRFIMKTQIVLNSVYDRIRAGLVRLRIDKFTRKLLKRQK